MGLVQNGCVGLLMRQMVGWGVYGEKMVDGALIRRKMVEGGAYREKSW